MGPDWGPTEADWIFLEHDTTHNVGPGDECINIFFFLWNQSGKCRVPCVMHARRPASRASTERVSTPPSACTTRKFNESSGRPVDPGGSRPVCEIQHSGQRDDRKLYRRDQGADVGPVPQRIPERPRNARMAASERGLL